MIEHTKDTTVALLRKTEKYTKTDMVYLTSGGFWLFLKVAFSTVLAILLSVAFANLLPQETYGAYKYVFTLFAILAIPTLTGMSTSVMRAVAQGFEGTPLVALRSKILWGMLGGLAGGCIATYYFVQGNFELAAAFAIVALFIPFVDTVTLFNSILTGKRLYRVSLLYEIATQSVAFASIITALFFTDDLWIILAAYFLSYTATRALAFWCAVRYHTKNKEVDKNAVSYGKHLSGMDILSVLAESADNLLLWQFAGAAPVAIYAFAKNIPLNLNAAAKRLITLTFPKFAARDFPSIKQQIPHKMVLIFVAMLIVVGLYWLVAPFLFAFLFPQYMEAVFYSQLFSLTLLFFPQKLIATAFQAHAKKGALYTFSIATPLIRIIAALSLIPFFGIMGALMMELIARVFNLLLMLFLLARTKEETDQSR